MFQLLDKGALGELLWLISVDLEYIISHHLIYIPFQGILIHFGIVVI